MTPLNEDTVNAAMAKLRERIAELEAFDAASKVTIEKMAKRINELEAQLAAINTIFIQHDNRPADYIQPESQPLGSHYEYVEGCKP